MALKDIQEQIAKLLLKGEPMRKLDDDDPKKDALTKIIDDVNALREEEAKLILTTQAEPPK